MRRFLRSRPGSKPGLRVLAGTIIEGLEDLKEHALGPHTRPRKSRNGGATPHGLFGTLPAPPGRSSSADGRAQVREAITGIACAAADRPRVRDARLPRARHDAEDDRVRVRDLDQHGRQPRGERVPEARRSRRRGGGARAQGRALLLRIPRRFRPIRERLKASRSTIVLPVTSSLKGKGSRKAVRADS